MNPQIIQDVLGKIKSFKAEIDTSFLPTIPFMPIRYQKYDIVVVTATIDEFHSFSRFLEKSEIKEFTNDPTVYVRGYITNSESRSHSVIMPIPSEMGVASAAIHATKAIVNFSPKHLFMVGICAGIRAVTKIGDVIIAEKTFDYNEVVEIENSDHSTRIKFMNNILDIPSYIKSKCLLFTAKYKFDFDFLKQAFAYEEKNKCHYGIIATGSSLLRSGERVRQLVKDYHNIKGIDMETYGIYKAIDSFENRNGEIQFLSIKGVSDYADNDKAKGAEQNTNRREIALYNSSTFLFNLIVDSI